MIQRLAAWVNAAAICSLAGWALFLVTSPWHGSSADSHGGMMAIAPGVLLLLWALIAFAATVLVRRRFKANDTVLAGISVLFLAAAVFLAVG